jgi:23S rRNA pseudouridine1911/1915/1917 synthase
MQKLDFHVALNDLGRRVDLAASEMACLTRSQIQRLIEKGLLTVNGSAVKPNYKTKAGDIISLTIPENEETLLREDIPVDVLYIDEYVAVVNKPPSMVVYPGAGHGGGTLMNALAFHSRKLASVGSPLRPGVVHRLDKDTSGVMVVALDDQAYYDLVEQFKKRTITRKYIALLSGALTGESGEISLKIGRSESDRKKMSTKVRRGKEAVTRWKVIERLTGATLIEARLGTGRTHQIRVHFAAVGHPVLGDRTYGKKTFVEIGGRKVGFPRQMLHAALLGFVHPVTGEQMEFSVDLPDDMKEKVGQLREMQAPGNRR